MTLHPTLASENFQFLREAILAGLGVGLVPSTNAWVAVPNSANVNTTNMTINPANGTVFYRLVYP